jgi:hypothetical protein
LHVQQQTDRSRKQLPATAEPYAGLLLQRIYSVAKILFRTTLHYHGYDMIIILDIRVHLQFKAM